MFQHSSRDHVATLTQPLEMLKNWFYWLPVPALFNTDQSSTGPHVSCVKDKFCTYELPSYLYVSTWRCISINWFEEEDNVVTMCYKTEFRASSLSNCTVIYRLQNNVVIPMLTINRCIYLDLIFPIFNLVPSNISCCLDMIKDCFLTSRGSSLHLIQGICFKSGQQTKYD